MNHLKKSEMNLSEIEIIKQAKQGDKSALLALYNQYLPLFKKLCRNRADYSNVLEVDDLLQECFLSLENALKNYSFEQETKFMTYLYECCKWHLYRVTMRYAYLPEYQLKMILKIKQFRDSYYRQHGKQPEDGLVMHEFSLSADCLRELDILKDLKAISLDAPTGEESDCALADLLPGVTDLEEKTVRRLSIIQLWKYLKDCLLPEELKVIKMLYLDRLTVKEISRTVGKSETEVRTIQARSLKKLRMKQKLKDIL